MSVSKLRLILITGVWAREKLLVRSVRTKQAAREILEGTFFDLKETASVELV